MPDGVMTLQTVQCVRAEYLRDQAHIFINGHGASIGHGNARCFLSAVLEREQSEERHARHIFIRSEDSDHAAFLVRMIFIEAELHSFLFSYQ